MCLLSFVLFFYDGKSCKALFKLLIGGDVVGHLAVVELFICNHIEVAGAGQTEHDGLFFAGFLALERFVDRNADRVAGFGSRQNALNARKLLGSFKY